MDTLRDIRLFIAASSWLDFSTGTGTTSLGQRRCSLVGGGPSSAFTALGFRGCSHCGIWGLLPLQRRCSLVGGGPSSAFTALGFRGCSHCGIWGLLPLQRRCSLVGGGPSSAFTVLGLRGCSRCGFRGCYLVKSSQTPLVHTLHPGLCSIFAFTTLIPSPPLPFLFFLSVGAPRRVYRVPASTWPAGLFFPQWCSKACVQGFHFFFFLLFLTPLSLSAKTHAKLPDW